MMDPHLLEEDEFEEAEPEKPEIKIKKIEGEGVLCLYLPLNLTETFL